jgi:hypothetical protein
MVADVDNLLKPILDALNGVAWVDDTQVCELKISRQPGPSRCYRIKMWQIPHPVTAYQRAIELSAAGHAVAPPAQLQSRNRIPRIPREDLSGERIAP